MRITIEIDTRDMDERDQAVLALLSGPATTPFVRGSTAAAASSGDAFAAPGQSGDASSAGATSATETTSEPQRRARRGVKATEAAASTPAATTSPGDVFSSPAATAPTATSAVPTGDVFSQQVKAANAAAAAEAAPGETAATKEAVSARVSELLPTLGAKGLRDVLGKFQKEDGTPVTVLRDLQPKDFGALLDDLSVYG